MINKKAMLLAFFSIGITNYQISHSSNDIFSDGYSSYRDFKGVLYRLHKPENEKNEEALGDINLLVLSAFGHPRGKTQSKSTQAEFDTILSKLATRIEEAKKKYNLPDLDINTQDNLGRTLLIKNVSGINPRNLREYQIILSYNDTDEFIDLLIAAKSNVNHQDVFGMSALMHIAYLINLEKRYASIIGDRAKALEYSENTQHFVIRIKDHSLLPRYERAIKILLEAGADLNLKTTHQYDWVKPGSTAYDILPDDLKNKEPFNRLKPTQVK